MNSRSDKSIFTDNSFFSVMENFLEELPHPAFSHLLPEGESKEANDFVSLKRSNLQMKSMTEKPSPVLGEGGPRQWWVREFCERKMRGN